MEDREIIYELIALIAELRKDLDREKYMRNLYEEKSDRLEKEKEEAASATKPWSAGIPPMPNEYQKPVVDDIVLSGVVGKDKE